MTEAETNRTTVARLMAILSGDAPIHAGSEIIAPDVVAHVDGWRFQGINVWANWIDYIRTRGCVAEPTLLLDEVVVHPDTTVTARGRWQGDRDGRVVTSKPAAATYRLAEGRIVEIWSTRRNYSFLCGGHLEYHGGLVFELLRARSWRQRVPRLDLLDRPRPQSASLPALSLAPPLMAPID